METKLNSLNLGLKYFCTNQQRCDLQRPKMRFWFQCSCPTWRSESNREWWIVCLAHCCSTARRWLKQRLMWFWNQLLDFCVWTERRTCRFQRSRMLLAPARLGSCPWDACGLRHRAPKSIDGRRLERRMKLTANETVNKSADNCKSFLVYLQRTTKLPKSPIASF